MTATSPPPSPWRAGQRGARLRGWLRREGLPLVCLLGLLLVARSSLANHYYVPSGSMEPTLLPGDRVVVDMRAYGLRVPFTQWAVWGGDAPARGDVVVFRSPSDGIRLIKRVVAVGGDRVDLVDGRLAINGAPLADPFDAPEDFGDVQVTLNLDSGGGPDLNGLQVPDGQVLVLGDHRGASIDGRYFGFVPAAAIYGQARGVFWRTGDGFGWRKL
ncbi:signal peptidase I [Luteimonas fraxinea]|uniref:Signal peptidase I n=1 Tax=Luteimonas fraxinea TaxID=2901869 RepID=A0ABS8UA46_9GAMM|nr:signal peptidase I [Luteimonas fraxinea]MCD9095857.1 signal peptidase I [Luteimonas fraxinea]MCD9124446.1 signal peptidase I [Luteimonas fraxinea]UHH10964.1 signal peptidase I [Luteimonas fraxinea]